MPPIIAAVATVAQSIFEAVGVGEALEISYGAYVAAATVLVTTGVSMIVSGVVGLISGALSGGQRPSSMIVSARDANAPWRLVYGFTRLAGVVTFVATSGENNGWLYLVLTLCKGTIQSIDTMYFNGAAIPVTPSTIYSGSDGGCFDGVGTQWGNNGNGLTVHVEYDLGNPANASQPFPGLAAEMPGYWTSACLQRGHAKAYVRLLWNQNLFSTGVPNITFDVHGRKVYDPRNSTTAWSANPALCLRDYLTDQTIGLQADASTEINDASFIAAANVCDQTVSLKGTISSIVPGNNTGDKGSGYKTGDLIGISGGNGDAAGWVANTNDAGAVNTINVSDPGSGYSSANEVATSGGSGHGLVVDITATSGTEPSYTCNGAFEVTETPSQATNDMCLAMAGYLTYVQGQFMAFAGAWQTPSVTLQDSDFRAALEIQTRYSRRDVFNSVHGTYLSEANDWQPSDYPAIIDGTWVNEDGIPLWKQIDLPFTTSASMAQRIAKIQLERSRRQITMTAHCKLTAGMIQPADVIMLTHPRFGWNQKTFLVTDVSFVTDKDKGDEAPALGVDLILQETDQNIYSWTAGDEIAAIAPALAPLPDPGNVAAPTNVTASSGASVAAVGADGIIINRILLQWTPAADSYVQNGGHYMIEYRLSSGPGPWLPAIVVDGASSNAYIAPVSGNTNYDIAIWSVNKSGSSSVVVEVLSVNTNVLISTFTGQAGTVATLANFTQDNLKGGSVYQQTPISWNSENAIQNPVFQYDSVGKQAAGWSGSGLVVSDTLPTGGTGNCLKATGANFSGNIFSNPLPLVPGQSYLYTAWIKTGGAGSWHLYFGNYADGDLGPLGAPTLWTPISATYAVPTNSTELIGQLDIVNGGATADWCEVWGASVVKLRNLDTEVSDGTLHVRSTATEAAGGLRAYTIIDSGNVVISSGLDMARSYTNKNADNIPAGSAYEILSIARQNAGLDTSGNLLFKGLKQTQFTTGTTIPSSISAIPPSLSITTHGYPVLILAVISATAGGAGNDSLQPYIYRDGVAITASAYLGNSNFAHGANDTKSILWLDDAPSAGSHTYELYGFSISGAMSVTGGTLFVMEFA